MQVLIPFQLSIIKIQESKKDIKMESSLHPTVFEPNASVTNISTQNAYHEEDDGEDVNNDDCGPLLLQTWEKVYRHIGNSLIDSPSFEQNIIP